MYEIFNVCIQPSGLYLISSLSIGYMTKKDCEQEKDAIVLSGFMLGFLAGFLLLASLVIIF